MAHKKGGGSSRNGRDSQPKMLGVKIYGGQEVGAGMILGAVERLRASPKAGGALRTKNDAGIEAPKEAPKPAAAK